MNNARVRNADLVSQVIRIITGWGECVPAGQLSVCFHAANSLGISWGTNDDPAECRNRRYLEALSPWMQPGYIDAFVSGSFKPDGFVHPFERHYTTPGSEDRYVLPEYFRAVDALTSAIREGSRRDPPDQILSFIYMHFLAIHPFVDGNGRVARNLLDYYNTALRFELCPVWNYADPKFADNDAHRNAFTELFREGAHLSRSYPPAGDRSVEELRLLLKDDVEGIRALASYLIEEATRVRQGGPLRESAGVASMAAYISSLQDRLPSSLG